MTEPGYPLGESGWGGAGLRIARYRFKTTFRHRWWDYGVLVLLIGLIGGVAMGSVQAGRRTQSSYPAFLAKTNASDLTLSTYGVGGPGTAAATYYSPKTAAAIARLPAVKTVESWVGAFAIPLERDGAPNFSNSNEINFAASKGLYFDEDRVTLIQGHIPNPNRANEFMTTALGASLLGAHLGQVLPIGLYTLAQAELPGFGTPRVRPLLRVNMTLTGIVEFNNQVIEDDTDRLPTNVVYTPAFTRLVPDRATEGTWYGIQLVRGDHDIAAAEQALLRVLPRGAAGNFSVTAITEAKVERAVKPESIALAMFGLISAAAALGIALAVIARQIRSTDEERQVLRAMGAGPAAALADALLGIVVAIAAGFVLACAVAVAISPLSPLGPVRAVYHPGIAFDWTVLGAGLLWLLGGLVLGATVIALRAAPQRVARRARLAAARPSKVAQAAGAIGLPLPGVVGLQFALEPGAGRTTVPARWVLAGAVIAVTLVTATLTFSSSLNKLVTHPKLYGWNWDYALQTEDDIPPQAIAALEHDPKVAAWSGYSDPDLQIDGQTVPALTTRGAPTVGPPILSGHGVQPGQKEVVLGAATLASLKVHIGSEVTISYGSPNTAPLYLPPTPAKVVGTATFPAIAGSSTFAEDTSMGTGVLLTDNDLPPNFLRSTESPDPTLDGPALVFVRMHANIGPSEGRRDMERIIAVAAAAFARDPNASGNSVIILPVQRPAEIVNYQSTGGTPVVLASGLATGAVIALAVALVATVRKRRQDLALLKTLGFTRGQLAITLTWQATVTALVGIVVGVPVGIAAGRQLWVIFARSIDAVPE
ncbi:MAG: FtsX-like permease family protein, partial [Acidimicrobiales bacterium]